MDIFSTGVLARVVAQLPLPSPFVLNSFFTSVQTETTEEIHFDVEANRRRLTPFVSPLVAGKIVQSKGYSTNTFKPAYAKDKRPFDANRPFKRMMGERIGGDLSPDQRLQAMLAYELSDQIDMVTRRQEVMACEAIRTGKVTVTGDNYPTVVVDFGRDAALTVDISGGAAAWGQNGVDPYDDVQTWSLLVTQKSGARANTLVMDVEAWKLFSASPKVIKLLDRFRGKDQLNSTVTGEGGRYMGNIGDYDIWVYAGWYEDPDTQVLTPYLPANTVIVTGPDLEGTRAYGAIRDESAGFQAMPYFAKSWVEQDPAVRYLLLQSAPLTVPYRINACLGAKVK
jgi:hypothetical protein